MDELLAKADVTLAQHLQDVLRFGNEIAKFFEVDDDLYRKALLACALHDIGKATKSFQKHIKEEQKTSGKRSIRAFPHALASMPLVLVAESLMDKCEGKRVPELYATATVLSHHTPLHPHTFLGYQQADYDPKLWEVLSELWTKLQELMGSGLPSLADVRQCAQSLMQEALSALLDDASSGQSIRARMHQLDVGRYAQVKSILHLSDWLASAKLPDTSVLTMDDAPQRLQSSCDGLSLYEFQKQCDTHSGQDVHLRAPTGTGKTEALLLWASKAKRIIYLLPTQATTNAMWRRLCRIFGDDKVALVHAKAGYILLSEDEETSRDRLLGSVFARPVTVATLDQYLLAHLNGRHWEERRSLARKSALIIDEVHTYEPYTLGLLLEAIGCEKPALLAIASATLPNALRALLPSAHLVEAESELWHRCRHQIVLHDDLLSEGIEQAVEQARMGKNVLVIANTIADAQLIYKRISEELGWTCTRLLHSRYTLRDRQTKEQAVQKPEPGTILVATQVVEVSLDISYDLLLTELAPLDALIQRMGRVNRKGDKPPANVFIYTQSTEGSITVYGEHVLQRTLDILRQLPSQPTDKDLLEATEQLYEYVTNQKDWQDELNDGKQTLREIHNVLGCYTIDLTDEEMRHRFKSRRGQVHIDVLPSQFIQEAYQLRDRNELWRIVELLVPVPFYWTKWENTRRAFAPCSDLGVYVTDLKYDGEYGLQLESNVKAFFD